MSLGRTLPSCPTIEEVSSRVTQANTRLLDSFVANNFLGRNVLVHQSPLAVSGVAAVLLHSSEDPTRIPSEVNYILRNTQFGAELIPLKFIYRTGIGGYPAWKPAQAKSEKADWKKFDRTHLEVEGRAGVREVSVVQVETTWIPLLNSVHLLLDFIDAQHRMWIDILKRHSSARTDATKIRLELDQENRTIIFILMIYCVNTLIKVGKGWPTLKYDLRALNGDFSSYLNSFKWFRDTFVPLIHNQKDSREDVLMAAAKYVYSENLPELEKRLWERFRGALDAVCKDLQALLYPSIHHLQPHAPMQQPLPPRPPTGQPPAQFSVGKRGSHERLRW